MNRSNLKWFAGGAAVASSMAVLGLVLNDYMKEEIDEPYIEFYGAGYTEEEHNDFENNFPIVVKLLRTCKVMNFEFYPAIGLHSSDKVQVNVTEFDMQQFECAMEFARNRKIEVNLVTESFRLQLVKAPLDGISY